MTKHTRLVCRRIFVASVSFFAMLSALISIPYLKDIETCLQAALTITGAYAWFAGVLYANIVLPMTQHDK